MARRHCSVMASPDHDVSRRGGDVGPHRYLEDQTDHSLFFCHLSIFCSETLLSRFLVASQPVRDLLLCAKHLFVAARTMVCSHHAAKRGRLGFCRLGDRLKTLGCGPSQLRY